jgi:hypothetical protein
MSPPPKVSFQLSGPSRDALRIAGLTPLPRSESGTRDPTAGSSSSNHDIQSPKPMSGSDSGSSSINVRPSSTSPTVKRTRQLIDSRPLSPKLQTVNTTGFDVAPQMSPLIARTSTPNESTMLLRAGSTTRYTLRGDELWFYPFIALIILGALVVETWIMSDTFKAFVCRNVGLCGGLLGR